MPFPPPLCPNSHSRRIASSYFLAACVGASGILMAHHPMILSGFRRVQGDLGDTRLNNYILEHGYRWFRGVPNHTNFWNPPVFFPARNTAAYSDLLLSVAPIYGAIRAFGFPSDTSFQIWVITISGLNFLMAFHFLRRRLQLGPMAASAGAFLFAFGAPRINHYGHQQLLPQFMGLITIDALFGLFPGLETPTWKRALLWLAAALGLIAQLYAGFYLGYFLLLSLGIASCLALAWPSTRGMFVATLRRDRFILAATAVLSGLLLWPMAAHYLAASREVGVRDFGLHVRPFAPGWEALFYLGPDSWLYGWLPHRLEFSPGGNEFEGRLGIGLITVLAGAAGLYWNRDRPSIRLITAAALILLLSILPVPRPLALGVSLAVSALALAGLYHVRGDHPWMRLLIPGLICVLVRAHLLANRVEAGVGFLTLLIVVMDLYQSRDRPRLRLLLGVLALGLGLSLFAPGVLALGACLGVLVAGAAVLFGLRPYRRAGAVAVVVLLLFACLATYRDSPKDLIAVAAASCSLALMRPARLRPSVDTLIGALTFALIAAVSYRESDIGWHAVYLYAPGASAIRAVGRVGIMVLIAWAIGLGCFVKTMSERRRPIGALVIMLICLMEQGLTFLSYDKEENRSAIAAIARRIDRRYATFYYSPHPEGMQPPEMERLLWMIANLNAMWAGLEVGVPTINGYSGNFPPDWPPLSNPNIGEECDSLCLEAALRHWARERHLSLERIDWIGGPEGWRQGDTWK